MTPAPATEFKMSIDILCQDHDKLNEVVVDFQKQLVAMAPGVKFKISPLLGRTVDAT